MTIRPEAPGDVAAIHALHAAAFPSETEADLVDRLRADGDATLSLVAEEDGQIAGHVLLSPMQSPPNTLGLGPVATAAPFRRRGLAAALIREALAIARAEGWQAVFVLGDPAYYTRFGFDPALTAPFSSPYAGPYFMALALGGTPLEATGAALYAPAFDGLE